MSNTAFAKASVVVFGLSLLTLSAYPVFAEDSSSAATARKPLLQQKISITQEKLENKVTAIRDKKENRIESLKEKIASRTAILKTKLETFKDKKKAAIAERINTNLNNINENQTAQMQKHLGTMSTILDKLEARVNNSSPDIKDPAAAKIAIAEARANIASASAAVTVQSQKDYTITVTFESRVKADIKSQRDKLNNDLFAIRKLVIDAKQSVANAIKVAKSGSEVKLDQVQEQEKEGTASGQR